jgi:hypothetical protein
MSRYRCREHMDAVVDFRGRGCLLCEEPRREAEAAAAAHRRSRDRDPWDRFLGVAS